MVPHIGPRAGFTLVEFAVATALLGVISGAIFMATDSSGKSIRTGSVVSSLENRGSVALDRIAEELSLAVRDDVLPGAPAAEAPFHASQLDFQISTWVSPNVILGNTARIGFEYTPDEPNDGVDNNGNGLIDEGRVVLTTDVGLGSEGRQVLCRGVSESFEGEVSGNGLDDNRNGLRDEGGCSFDFDGDRVTIRLTLAATDSQGLVISRTFTRTVALKR